MSFEILVVVLLVAAIAIGAGLRAARRASAELDRALRAIEQFPRL